MFEFYSFSASEAFCKGILTCLFFILSIQLSYGQADLAIQGASISPTSVPAGTTIYATSNIYNLGNTAASVSDIGYYLSANNTFDETDTLIGSSAGNYLAAANQYDVSSYRSTYLTIPANTTTGNYYILYVADYLNNVTESNEQNNISVVSITIVPATVDLTLTNTYLHNSSVAPGNTVNVRTLIANQGNSTATPCNIGYYLSENNTLDNTDIFIGAVTGSDQSAGNYVYLYSAHTIPTATTTGTYYLIAAADYSNIITESNETNNTIFEQISIVPPAVDLTLSSLYLYNSSVVAGSTGEGSLYISNTGNTNASSSNIGVYLSTNNTLDNSDVFIGSSRGGPLPANDYYYHYPRFTIPGGTLPGSYYVLFVADYLNNVTETNENNNVNSAALTVVTPNVDFTVSSFNATTIASAGSSINTNITINNYGNTASPNSNVGYYLSTNNTFEPADTFIGSTNISSIYAGGSDYNRSTTLTIPDAIVPGTYYLIAVADYQSSVTEINENNNTVSTSLRITEPGTTFLMPTSGSINYTTCTGALYDNGGPGNYSDNVNGTMTLYPATAGNKVRLIFNSFGVESCCDRLAIYDGTSTAAPLIGSYTYNPGTIYATNSSGALTLVFTTDGSVVYPGFEAEIACVTTVPLPDLSILTPTASPTTLSAGMSFTVSASITNQGTAMAASSHIGYYLSADTTFTTADIYLGNSAGYYSLATNNTSFRNNTLAIPDNIAPGNYYLLYVADPLSYVNEDDETNNTDYVAITIAPPYVDLVAQSVSLGRSNTAAGNAILVTANIANTGNMTAPSSNVTYYLSTNNTFETTDVLLTTVAGNSLSASGTASTPATITIPTETEIGSYYILALVDKDNTVTESNENNNFTATAITIEAPTIDLIAGSISSPTSIMAGATPRCSVVVTNVGNSTSPTSNLGIYLSSDNTLDAADILIGSGDYTSVEPGINYNFMSGFTIPANTAAGSYYILAKVDYNNRITESNETNNVVVAAITISVPLLPDLVIQSPTIRSTTADVGRGIHLSSTIANIGNISANSAHISYYLSTNNILEASDVLLGNSYYDILAAGKSVLQEDTPLIPLYIVAGNYFILFVADSHGFFTPDTYGAITESNETNNIASIPITITSLPDLVVSEGNLLEVAASPGGTVSVTGGIRNVAYSPAESSTIGYYLSTNNTLDASDILLGTSNVGPVVVNASTVSVRTNLTIPTNTVPGNYFIIYVADYNNAVVEVNENNNQSYRAFFIMAATQPDLIIESMFGSSNHLEAGKSTAISGKILNQGNANANSSSTGIYFSADTQLDANDILLRTDTAPALSANSNNTLQAEIVIPVGTTPGSYYILVKADNNNELTESNENNNLFRLPVVISFPAPHLVVQSSAINAETITPGGSVTANATIANIGTHPSPASKIRFYLSADNNYDSTDVLLGEFELALLTPNTSAELKAYLTIPANTASGNYYILVVANNTQVIAEKEKINDVARVALTVSTVSGINDLANGYTITVSPNPTPDKVNIKIDNLQKGERTAEITLSSINGEKILSTKAKITNNKLTTSLNVQHLSNGTYLLHIQIGKARVVKKIVLDKH